MNDSAEQRSARPIPLNLNEHAKGFNITSLTVQTPTSQQAPTSLTRLPNPQRWTTPEFLIYGVLFLIVFPMMIYSPYNLSNESHRNYYLFQARLSKGWIAGRRVDNSDPQYRGFRNNLFNLFALALLHLALSRTYNFIASQFGSRSTGKRSDNLHRIPFMVTFAVILTVVLHGASAIKVFVILSGNYVLSKRLGGWKFGPAVLWTVNLAVLFGNELNDGYRFGLLHPSLGYLDAYRGMYPGWHITFNITVLRLLSFGMDYHWACSKSSTLSSSVPLNARERTTTSHPLAAYDFMNYIAYTLYSPLYIAGPIMTFNDFYWQLRRPYRITSDALLSYTIRFFVCLLSMEMILHFMYVVAIKDSKAFIGDSPMELSMIGFWNLIIMWLKLLLPWRFFRLWALADGMYPPENMVRCPTNSYTIGGFWRAWHKSYNLWLIRYIYIPLGGSGNVVVATLLSFTFVALWHDLKLRLLAWGWLISLFIIPEIVLSRVFTEKKYGDEWYYRHLRALGGVANVLVLMIANLVGFVIGLDGIEYLLGQLTGTASGLGFLLVACACLFIAVQFMLEYREEEKRRGIYRKY